MNPPRLPADHRAWPLTCVLLLAAVTAYFNWPVVSGLGAEVTITTGDGWKNLYTVAYHVLHDTHPTHSTAMNWPYGEHVAMGDGQWALSEPLRLVNQVVPLGERALLYLIMVLPLLSIPLCGLLVYANLRLLGMTRFAAAAWALPLALLQPQLQRVSAHFGLAYAVMIPGLLLLWRRQRRRRYTLGSAVPVAAALAVGGLLHFYNLAIGAALLLSLLAADGLLHRRVGWGRAGALVLAQVVAPLAVCLAVAFATDAHADRVANPYGIDVYKSAPRALVYDERLPWWRALEEAVGPIDAPPPEGLAYLGFFIGAAAAIGIGTAAVRRLRGQRGWPSPDPGPGEVLTCLSVAGLVVGAYSWGFPMGMQGEAYDWIRDHAGPLQQFRGLGRFAWATYYCLGLVGAYASHALSRGGGWSLGLVVLMYVFTLVEGLAIWEERTFYHAPHYMAGEADAIRAALSDVDAAAVVPIPAVHVGSENFYVAEMGHTLYSSTYVSLATGIPNAGLHLSRTSFAQSEGNIQLAYIFFNVPEVLRSVDGGNAYVLAVDGPTWRTTEWVRGMYGPLVELSELVYESEAVSLYVVAEERLPDAARAMRRRYLDLYYPGVSLDADDAGPIVLPSDGYFRRVDFDALDNAVGLGGSGGVDLCCRPPEVPIDGAALPDVIRPGQSLGLSLLLEVDEGGEIFAPLSIRFYDQAGAQLSEYSFRADKNMSQLSDGWARIGVAAPVPEAAVAYALYAEASAVALAPGGVIDEVVWSSPGTFYAYRPSDAPDPPWLVYGYLWHPL